MEILKQLADFLGKRQVRSYLVGGSVRDQVLGLFEMRDVDLGIEGDASGLARAFANQTGAAFYLMDAEHNVARVLLGKLYVDMAELRGSILEDLGTRDLTINAMARPFTGPDVAAGAVIDPFHGLQDLAERKIRSVSDQSFLDPVRLLRAIRIAGELNFEIEPHTRALMQRDAPLLAGASMERARDELFKILGLADPVTRLREMDELGLLAALLPEITALKGVTQSEPHSYDVFEHTLHSVSQLVLLQADAYAGIAGGEFATQLRDHFGRMVSAERSRGILLRLATLLHDIGKPVTRSVDEAGAVHFYRHEARGASMAVDLLRRLRLSNSEIEIVARSIQHHLRPPQLARSPQVTNRAIYRFFHDLGDAGIDVCVLALADTRGKAPAPLDPAKDAQLKGVLKALLGAYYETPPSVVAPPVLLDGRTLMQELNLQQGPLIGKLLEEIREAQAEGQVHSRAEAIALARKLIQGKHAHGSHP